MTPELFQRIEELYHAAREGTAEERAVLLAQTDPELRREVELLLSQQTSGDFLDRPAVQNAPELLEDPTVTGLAAGVYLGPYRIESKVGEGGMGEVFRAVDTRLGRAVAIKTMRQQFSTRFEREARAISSLNHPNVCTLYDIGPDYLVMELVEGDTLSARLKSGPLPVRAALLHALQILAALVEAHDRGIVHRDLKPSNIMIAKSGIKVLDFGLAKSGRDETVTVSQMVLGTPAYTAPEQMEGKPADARSDIYSFGCLFYEMLTGARLGLQRRRLPSRKLERIITRCLEEDPARRWQSAADLERELAGVTATGSRSKLVIAAALGLLALFGAGYFYLRRDRPYDSPSAPVPLTSYAGHEVQPSFSPDGNQVVFVWDGEHQDNADLYVKLLGSEKPLRLTTDPAADISPAWSPDGRFIAFLRNQTVGTRKTSILLAPAIGGTEKLIAELNSPLPSSASGLRYMALAPFPLLAWAQGGKSLIFPDRASADEPPGLFLLSLETGEKRRLTSAPPGSRGDGAPAVSANGRNLIFSREASWTVSDLYRLPLTTDFRPAGQPVRLTSSKEWNSTPVWTLGDRDIIFSSGNWYLGPFTLWRMPALKAAAPQRLVFGEGGGWPALSPERGRLVFSRAIANDNIWRVPLRGKSPAGPPVKFISSTRSQDAPQYSPDGKKIVFTSNRSGAYEIWICESDGSNAVPLTSLRAAMTGSPHWSPDGKQIVFDSNSEGRFEIYLINATGGVPHRLTAPESENALASFSHAGGYIYFASDRTKSWEVWKMPASGGDALQVTHGGGRAPLESPDGKFVYYEKVPGRGLWRLPTAGGEETKILDSVGYLKFTLTEGGIYFAPRTVPPATSPLLFFSFASDASKQIVTAGGRIGTGMTISPDKKSLLYTRTDQSSSDLMVVEKFR